MPITFKNSPLVELIVELKWDIGVQQIAGAPPGAPAGVALNPAECEAFFMRFTGPAFGAGYKQIERLVPHGFPLFAHQPVMRFRPGEGKGLLFQVGPGILTVNAMPPYKSWADFEPEIRKALEALFQSRSAAENAQRFTGLNLRYLDAFSGGLTQQRTVANFLKEVLGIEVHLPEAVTRHATAMEAIKPSVQVQVPMQNERLLSLSFGDGFTNNSSAYVMDTSIATLRPVEASADAVMNELTFARGVIHEMFFAMTKPLYDEMQPEGEE